MVEGLKDKQPKEPSLHLSQEAKVVTEIACQEAEKAGRLTVLPEDFLIALARGGEPLVVGLLEDSGVSVQKLRSRVAKIVSFTEQHQPPFGDIGLSREAILVIRKAASVALGDPRGEVDSFCLLVGVNSVLGPTRLNALMRKP